MTSVPELSGLGPKLSDQTHCLAQVAVGAIERLLGLVHSKTLKKKKCELDAAAASLKGAFYVLAAPASQTRQYPFASPNQLLV
jgi:hypothetical protein